MTNTQPINFHQEAGAILPHLQNVEAELATTGGVLLLHLMKLRASQINQCAYCVKLHIAEALKDGETQERLVRLVVWRHVSDFSDKERAALAWTEALTNLDRENYGSLRADLREHFSNTEIALLTGRVAMINLWNRIQVSNH